MKSTTGSRPYISPHVNTVYVSAYMLKTDEHINFPPTFDPLNDSKVLDREIDIDFGIKSTPLINYKITSYSGQVVFII